MPEMKGGPPAKLMRNICIISILVMAVISAAAKEPSNTSVAKAEIIEITNDGSRRAELKLRLPNPWRETVYVGVCDTPIRLSGITAYLERLTNGEWKRVMGPKGVVLGDLPPLPHEIAPGDAIEVNFSFDPTFLELSSKTKLRAVVLARTKDGAMGIGIPSPRFTTQSFTLPMEP